MEPIVLVHAGSGSPSEWSDGCIPAAEAGAEALRGGGSALDAAVAAVRVMEEDPRFNAGRGSFVRLDGKTIEMDAAVMDSEGRIGAVAALRGFLHPVEVARAVLGTPHCLLAAEGAARFAAARGFEPFDGPPSERSLLRHRGALRMLRERSSKRPAWREADPAVIWNFPGPPPEDLTPRDTVGAVVRGRAGDFAVASSSGGAVPMMMGRVGDTPLPGSGFWAGPAGAAAPTGFGEEIMRRLAAWRTYAFMEQGLSAEEAADRINALFPEHLSFGVIAVSARDHGLASNRNMATAVARP